MNISGINPHIRFTSVIDYKSEGNPVRCADCRLYYILSGNAQILIDNQAYQLEKNSVFYCSGGSRYELKSPDGITMLCLNFDLNQKHNDIITPIPTQGDEQSAENMQIFHTPVADSEILTSHIMLSDGTAIHHSLNKIIREFSECKIFYRESAGAILKEILIRLTRQELRKTSVIDDVIAYIHENYDKNITNKELAELASYHEYHLNKLFIRHTGTSIHNYILNIRINRAKQLILNSDYSLGEISEMSGFNNYTYFSTYFKQTVGITPFQYKKSLKNKV